MKLKPIERKMIVHCKSEQEAKELIKWSFKCGYRWIPEVFSVKDTNYENYKEETCYLFGHYESDGICIENLKYYKGRNIKIIEFTDLIEEKLE